MSRINNSFQLSGFLGADPEKRFNQHNGKPISLMSIGVDASYKNRDTSEIVEQTDWFDLTFYSEGLIKVIDQYVRKGSEITVRGYMRKRTWESKERFNEDGTPRMDSRYEFVVTQMRLGRRPKGSDANQGTSQDLARANALASQASEAAPDFEDDIPL